MQSKLLTPCLLLSLLIGGANSSVQAQEPAAPTTRSIARPNPAGRFAEGFGPGFMVLTDEQRSSVVQAMQVQRDQSRELEQKLREARKELFTSGLDGKFDEEAVRKHALAVATLEAEMAVLRARAFSQVQPPLSPEQIEKIKSSMPASPPAPVRPADQNPRRRILQDSTREQKGSPPGQ
jgi:Spy/CpxP family protein refolding chaperone